MVFRITSFLNEFYNFSVIIPDCSAVFCLIGSQLKLNIQCYASKILCVSRYFSASTKMKFMINIIDKIDRNEQFYGLSLRLFNFYKRLYQEHSPLNVSTGNPGGNRVFNCFTVLWNESISSFTSPERVKRKWHKHQENEKLK